MNDFVRVILIIVFLGILPAILIGLVCKSFGIEPPTEEELRRRREWNREYKERLREYDKRSAVARTSFKVAQDSFYTKEYLDKNPAVRAQVTQHLVDYETAIHK